jgi:hypothetical protein
MWVLYILATYQFLRFYLHSTTFYLKLANYMNGTERLPFQERVLPILLLRGIKASPLLVHFFQTRRGPMGPVSGPQFVIDLVAFAVAAFFLFKLYYVVSRTRTLAFLVYPVFLYTSLWSYSVRTDQDFNYPYDMMALAFFTAGLYFIYTRQYWPLVAVMLIGTFNRETTLFLIGIFVLDAASVSSAEPADGLRQRFELRTLPWLRIALLCVVWIAIKGALSYAFRFNDRSEDHLRFGDNLRYLNPKEWPGALNICGYLLWAVMMLFRRLQPVRFANYLYILALWFPVMIATGLLIETRIYAELSSYVAIAFVLELENYIRTLPAPLDATAVPLQTSGAPPL